eukprot:Lankesteria_metandrocarpae@DN4278_c0_g1_i1.p1
MRNADRGQGDIPTGGCRGDSPSASSECSFISDADEFLWDSATVIDIKKNDLILNHLAGGSDTGTDCSSGSNDNSDLLHTTATPSAKIIDFNSAAFAEPPMLYFWDADGTRLFTPPECFANTRDPPAPQENADHHHLHRNDSSSSPKKKIGIQGQPRDMWSVGCLVSCMLNGIPPFWADTSIGLILVITQNDANIPAVNCTGDAISFIRQLLVKEPNDRLTLQNALRHPFITQHAPAGFLTQSLQQQRKHSTNPITSSDAIIHV